MPAQYTSKDFDQGIGCTLVFLAIASSVFFIGYFWGRQDGLAAGKQEMRTWLVYTGVGEFDDSTCSQVRLKPAAIQAGNKPTTANKSE